MTTTIGSVHDRVLALLEPPNGTYDQWSQIDATTRLLYAELTAKPAPSHVVSLLAIPNNARPLLKHGVLPLVRAFPVPSADATLINGDVYVETSIDVSVTSAFELYLNTVINVTFDFVRRSWLARPDRQQYTRIEGYRIRRDLATDTLSNIAHNVR